MSGEMAIRRRRALYRATHRGTKEMDWLLGRFADGKLDGMTDQELTRFERLIAMPDPDLHGWIMQPESLGETDIAADIGAIREFHQLGDAVA